MDYKKLEVVKLNWYFDIFNGFKTICSNVILVDFTTDCSTYRLMMSR